MVHKAFVEMVETISETAPTHNERRIAGLLLGVYKASADNPAVVKIINDFALDCLEQGDSEAA